jgi:phosphohistidine phosphatase
VEREDWKNKDDSLRPLTDKGILRTEKLCRELKHKLKKIDLLVSSPYLRAKQTAEIVKSQLRLGEIEFCPELTPECPPQAFARWVQAHAKGVESILAVGHEPQMSVFASWLLTGKTVSILELKKSGIINLLVPSFFDLTPETAKLKWMVSSSVFPD